jgi:hypothetical protein
MPTVTPPDPLVLAPYKVPKNAPNHQKEWLRGHGWPIDLVPMTLAHAEYWDRSVVPTIQRIEFERYAGIRPNELPRADAYWRYSWPAVWRVFRTAAHLPVRAAGHPPMVARAHLWALEAASQGGQPVPVGLLLGLSRYPFPVSSRVSSTRRAGVFAWLLTVAPADTMQQHELPTNLALGRAMVDCAVQLSLGAQHVGSVLLHADPRGGDELAVFYESCFMEQLDPDLYPNISATRRNDGRYYVFDLQSAGRFALVHARFRLSAVGHVDERFAPYRLIA